MKLLIDVPDLTGEDLASIQAAAAHLKSDAVIAWLPPGSPVRDHAIISAELVEGTAVAYVRTDLTGHGLEGATVLIVTDATASGFLADARYEIAYRSKP